MSVESLRMVPKSFMDEFDQKEFDGITFFGHRLSELSPSELNAAILDLNRTVKVLRRHVDKCPSLLIIDD